MAASRIGDPCADCGETLTDYNGMPVCAGCYERATLMRIGLFYFSEDPLEGSTPVPFGDGLVYVRVGEAKSDEASDALREAEPREGERFLNSHPVEPR